MKKGMHFREYLGKEYEIVDIDGDEVTAIIVSGEYAGGASVFSKDEVKRMIKHWEE